MKKHKLTITLFSCFVTAISIVSCVKDTGKIVAANTNVTGCDTVTYTKHIKPIIDANCISCHGDVNPTGGFSLNSYAQAKLYGDNGKIKATVLDPVPTPELMPQGGPRLPQAQLD